MLLLLLFLLASSTKYVKQVVLINHSWIASTLQKRWGLGFCLFSKKGGSVHFPQKMERLVKYWRKVSYCRESNLHLLLIFVFIREEVHTQVATTNVKLTLVSGWVWSRDVRCVAIWYKSFLTHFTSEGNDFCLPSSFFISLSGMIGALCLWQIAEENQERQGRRNIQTCVTWSTLQYFQCSKIASL